jgi:phage-related minor tail protein
MAVRSVGVASRGDHPEAEAMKINVTIAVEMTNEQVSDLMAEYGIERNEVRQFVRDGITTAAQNGGASSDFWTATLKAN